MVEYVAVNHGVAGSSPARGATSIFIAGYLPSQIYSVTVFLLYRKGFDYMGKSIIAIILTVIAWFAGIMIGAPVNMGADLGHLFAILVMGGLIIYYNEKKNK